MSFQKPTNHRFCDTVRLLAQEDEILIGARSCGGTFICVHVFRVTVPGHARGSL